MLDNNLRCLCSCFTQMPSGVPICEKEEIVTHAFFPTRIVPELRGSQSSLPLSSESESSIDSSVLCRLTCFDDL